MRIISIETVKFGTVDIATPLELASGLNILAAPNQSGKSTLLTAIEWALYGVDAGGRGKPEQAIERWRPWQGGEPHIVLTLAPDHPDWPERVRIAAHFDDLAPQVTNAENAQDLAGQDLYMVQHNGSWDIGRRLTGLSRSAYRASLYAPQNEVDNILTDASLRRILTTDLGDLVPDPEKAGIDAALDALKRPEFAMLELAPEVLPIGQLLRDATYRWKMTAGELDNQSRAFEAFEKLMHQRENAERELREVEQRLVKIEHEMERLRLAAAYWRYERADNVGAEIKSWQPRMENEPWLREFPGTLQPEVDVWQADWRSLREQIATAEAHGREADALREKAPYVEDLELEAEEEVIRRQERLRGIQAESSRHEDMCTAAEGKLQELNVWLEDRGQLDAQTAHTDELRELRGQVRAAQQERQEAEQRMEEYGLGENSEKRSRLDELENTVDPHRDSLGQMLEYIERHDQLRQSRGEWERRKLETEHVANADHNIELITGIIVAIVGLLFSSLGPLLLEVDPDYNWIIISAGVIVVLLGAVFIFRHVARKRSVRAARNELTETIQPKLGQLEERERELEQFRSEVQQQHELAPAQWDELVDILPEYQKLRLALEHYSQALHEFHSAQSRIEQAWGRVRELAPDAPEDPDTSWMASRIEELVDFTDQKRLRDETQGAREAENRQIDELKQEADQVRNELHDHLDKYNLGEQLEEDLDAAVAEFQAMARKTREYRQLRAEAQSLDKLHLRQRELIDRLAEIMDAVGLAEEARQNHEQALEQYEQRKQEAQRYQNLLNQHQDLLNQAEATGLTRELFTERWGRESELEQQALEGMVADETEYGELLKRIESLAEEENLIKHSLNQNQQKAIRLREMLAREKHIPGAYDEAFRKEEEARKQMNTVRVWQRALLILEEKFRQVQRDLSGRMAPAIVEGVDKVLARTPLGNIAGVEVGGNMELKVQLKDAPEKLSAGDRIQLLSSGARRQLALVVRLGVADALGAERSAPLMLDEPLDELDDTRAKDCLKFLGALATDTQVLLTTCHRHNHEWMLESTGVAAHELALTQQGSKTATATTVEPPAMDSGE